MAVYAITGKLGSGKGKAAMFRLREYLRAGKRVATNCDTFLEHMCGEFSRESVIRVPDKPTVVDLYLIGSGNKFLQFEPNIRHTEKGVVAEAPGQPVMLKGFDEAHNGALILDECASWLNTRNFQDKGRADLLEWFIHARKYGWDIYFICQNISQIDKQLRDSLFEYCVRLNRLDRMRLPILSDLAKVMTAGTLDGNMPRLHIAVVRIGCSPDGLVADRWFFRGDDLHQAYNTTQVFSDAYPHGTHSLLSAWHLGAQAAPLPADFVGPHRGRADWPLVRYRSIPQKRFKHMGKALVLSVLLGAVLGVFGTRQFWPRQVVSALPVVHEKVTAVAANALARGFMRRNGEVVVFLADGSMVKALEFREQNGAWEAKIGPTTTVRGGGAK
jgi:hypothetical protein